MRPLAVVAVLISLLGVESKADVFNMTTGMTSLSFVRVGDAGNVPDTAIRNDGTTGYGSVGYEYLIGTYDVTTAQYAQFLNAVARIDTYGLYDSGMGSDLPTVGILRTSTPSGYSYVVKGDGNVPAFDVSWPNAARFCNWLQNGQPSTGVQNSTTTESGAYPLNGANSDAAVATIPPASHAGSDAAQYFLPTEDEWYKAAYYHGGGTASTYWKYPTQSDIAPLNSLALALTDSNEANYCIVNVNIHTYTDPTNHFTPVGTFVASAGPYGTYDMGGDAWQWSESQVPVLGRVICGGDYGSQGATYLASTSRIAPLPTHAQNLNPGFRVAGSVAVPEPGSLVLLLAGVTALLALFLCRHGRAAIVLR
jgi:formylglycine-generating enzyme